MEEEEKEGRDGSDAAVCVNGRRRDGRRAGAGVRTDAIREEFGVLLTAHIHCLSSACGRGFVRFVFDAASVHSPKTKHAKLLPQADERRRISASEDYFPFPSKSSA